MKLYLKIFTLFVSFQSALCLRPRGVRPDMAGFYDPNAVFHCLDGSDSIPFDMVNDDYCDCKDGSDEPGTSACSNGSFYCSNRGFKPSNLKSSRVNDGICDCCDGSDEWAMVAGSACKNNCDEMGAIEKAERARLEKVVEEGLRLKSEMESQGTNMRRVRESEIEEKKSQLDKLHEDMEAKKLVKEDAESAEKAALDVIREEEEREKAILEEQERKEKEAEALEFFHKFDTNQDGRLSKEEIINIHVFDQNNDGMVSDEEADFYLSGNENYDQEGFLNTGWLLMKHLLSKYEKKKGQQQETDIPEAGEDDHGNTEDYDYDDLEESEDDSDEPTIPADEQDKFAEEPETKEEKPKYSPEVQVLVDTANAARDEFNTAERAYRDVDFDVGNLQKHLDKDYGPNEVFAPLANQCFEFNDLEYTYKMCAFDYTAQKPLHGGSETRLGSWEKWSIPHIQMGFERGVQCWNGPQRSTKVNLRCGAENKLVSAAEPNRCEYEFMFETPAACQPLPPTTHHDEL